MNAAPHAWDRAADGWDRQSPMLGAWLREATTAMLDAARVGQGARVLDVAAGAGEQTLEIARRVRPGGQVLATDISPRGLQLARARLHQAGFDFVQTQVADAQALHGLNGPDGRGFDAVVSRLGLMFCQRPLDALSGARAVLRPGGRLAALVFAAPPGNPCLAVLMATASRHAGRPPPAPFEPGSLMSLGRPGLMADLLAQAGFDDIDVRPIAAPMRLASVGRYIDFVQSAGLPVMALLAPLPATAQQAAWQDIEQQLQRFTSPSGWVGPNELLLCSATRPPTDSITPKDRP